jgi:competence protein ComEC
MRRGWRWLAVGGLAFAHLALQAPRQLGAALLADHQRWVLWLPVALGVGIGGYFALTVEPPPFVAPLGMVASVLGAVILRRRQGGAMLALLLGAIFCGGALAQWRTRMVAAPVLERRWGPEELTGRVYAVEIRPDGRRVTIDQLSLPGLAPAATPEQVRVRLADGSVALRPGDRIALRAQLFPPPAPAAPGAYDFQL